MTEVYFDVETSGVNFRTDKIISIQFQELRLGMPTGRFYIIDEDEYGSEERIINALLEQVDMTRPNFKMTWAFKGLKELFIPVGLNLYFDLACVARAMHRYIKNEKGQPRSWWPNDFYNLKCVDIKHILLMMNAQRGDMFRGWSDLLKHTKYTGRQIAEELYPRGRWKEIREYVEEEKEHFCAFYSLLHEEMALAKDRIIPKLPWVLDLKTADLLSNIIMRELAPLCERIEVVGSTRRKRPVVRDIDFAAIPKRGMDQIADAVKRMPGYGGETRKGEKTMTFYFNGEKVNVFLADRNTWAMTKVQRTGSKEFNMKLYSLAQERKINLHEIQAFEEQDIFDALGMEYVEPEMRI